MIETKKSGLNREIEALKNIEHFGFLTTKSIADLTEDVEGDTALKSAKRVVKRLLEKKEILKRLSLDGINCFVLSKTGAKRVESVCFEKTARSGAEIATRHARRQELIVSKLCKKRKEAKSKTVLLGEVWLRRDAKKRFAGFHGLMWNFETKKAIAIFVASSCHNHTAEHIVNLHFKHEMYLEKIIIIAMDEIIKEVVLKKTNKEFIAAKKRLLEQKTIDL